MTDWYYYYQLKGDYRILYKRIVDCIIHRQRFTLCDDLNVYFCFFAKVRYAVEYDNPQLFYVDFNNITCFVESKTDKIEKITITYLYSSEDTTALQELVNKSSGIILSRLAVEGYSELQKVWKTHDLLIDNVDYFDEALVREGSFEWYRASSILGLFLDKKAICSGISMALKLILNQIGIRSIVVSGFTINESGCKEGHSWNIVKIDGISYHIDMTWDICMSCNDQRCYDYFNLKDELIFKDHFTDSDLPSCCSDKDNYFERNGAVIRDRMDWQRYFTESYSQIYGDYYVRIDYHCDFDKEIERIKEYYETHNPTYGSYIITSRKNERQNIIRVTVNNG